MTLSLTLNNNMHLPLIMVISCIKALRSWSFQLGLYPAYNVSYHVFLPCDNTTLSFNLQSFCIFLLCDNMTLTFDLEIQKASSSYGDQFYQAVWSWNLRFILYHASYVTKRPWPLTTDFEIQYASYSHHADHMYQVVRSRN